MIEVTAIQKGIVIDHIPAGKGLKVFEKLRLDRRKSPSVLLMHVSSRKRGTKDIIKIQDDLTVDLRILGLIDPGITVNYIENEQIIDKKEATLPEKVSGLFACKNPRCITAVDECAQPEFTLVPNGKIQYRCSYCEELTEYRL
ncbi:MULTISPECIES: aspartate carbamoyltransferase regulatory subunit [Anoxynatronum]|uniref:Aspartate carbamoyltransferase regulatory subunit n=2 Tax=Anoxynatronum TaxID=210622 RepID=A0AA45WV28_9CLOT|nr:aspartate carbamoyltransferase regulatory subunit [Anoxynatronum buryatiense]SMP50902.1 aspartate carbamoyltransferase regulatory subunit [Anoxynatronum buryatiense]